MLDNLIFNIKGGWHGIWGSPYGRGLLALATAYLLYRLVTALLRRLCASDKRSEARARYWKVLKDIDRITSIPCAHVDKGLYDWKDSCYTDLQLMDRILFLHYPYAFSGCGPIVRLVLWLLEGCVRRLTAQGYVSCHTVSLLLLFYAAKLRGSEFDSSLPHLEQVEHKRLLEAVNTLRHLGGQPQAYDENRLRSFAFVYARVLVSAESGGLSKEEVYQFVRHTFEVYPHGFNGVDRMAELALHDIEEARKPKEDADASAAR